MEFKLSSPAFNNGTMIPSRYTCDGENINPHLVIHGVPQGCKSLVLIVDDPDAPGGTWDHWLLWNIPPDTKEIREETAPFGSTAGANGWGKAKYGGPCPPSGEHRYFFRLYALDVKLHLEQGALREELERGMEGHIIASTDVMGTYTRTNAAPV